MQRIYGTAWENQEALDAYLLAQAEAERRDHRKLGNELDLFSFPDQLGSGLAVFHPKGGIIRNEMEQYSRLRHIQAGYDFVNTPHITKGQLYETSGHLDWYREGMFPAMHLDAEYNDDGSTRKPGQDYYLKPMNCPMHNLIFDARGRSYRELPLRLFEFGTVYRNEPSGVIHGLTRARGFTQDDAHIYCTREQMRDELASLLQFVLNLLKDYGLDDFYLELSTRNPAKSVGDDATWEEATATLAEVATASGLELVPDPEGAAFYGPKISVQARDAIGRTWQMSTIQLDFNLPERFELEYSAADGTRQRPVMIHRALFGSIERFFGVLTEHYAGAFPAWLSPVHVVGIPVADAFGDQPGGRRRGGQGPRDQVPGRPLRRPDAEEDPQPHHRQGAVHAARRSRRHGIRIGVLQIPRRVADQRRPGRPGDRSDPRLDHPSGQRLARGRAVRGYVEGRRLASPRRLMPESESTPAVELVHQDGIGIPDQWARLWTPHRMAYVTAQERVAPDAGPTCPFCRIPTLDDEAGLIVARGVHVYAVLNLFPYNPGHLMVVPYRHIPDYTELEPDEMVEFSAFTSRAMTVLRKVSGPHGFNIGMNAGESAGAGIAAHLHQHVVPRWGGDANFMPVIGATKVLPQLLGETRGLLAAAW